MARVTGNDLNLDYQQASAAPGRYRRHLRVGLAVAGALFVVAALGFLQPLYTEGRWIALDFGDTEAEVDRKLWTFAKEAYSGPPLGTVPAVRHVRYRFYGPGGADDIVVGFDQAGELVVAYPPFLFD